MKESVFKIGSYNIDIDKNNLDREKHLEKKFFDTLKVLLESVEKLQEKKRSFNFFRKNGTRN